MSQLNCPISWFPWSHSFQQESSLIQQTSFTYNNSTIPGWFLIYYCQSNWLTSSFNIIFILVSIQFYLSCYCVRAKNGKSRKSTENLHKQHHNHSNNHSNHQNVTQSVHVLPSSQVRSISQSHITDLGVNDAISEDIDCSVDNGRSHLISFWNQMTPKVLLDIFTLMLLFIVSLSIIELLQSPWNHVSDHFNGRFITLVSTMITLLVNYFIVFPQLGLLLLKPGYGNSLYRVTFLIIVVSYWTITIINLACQLGLLLNMGLSIWIHIRLQLTLASMIITTWVLCAKLSAILMTKRFILSHVSDENMALEVQQLISINHLQRDFLDFSFDDEPSCRNSIFLMLSGGSSLLVFIMITHILVTFLTSYECYALSQPDHVYVHVIFEREVKNFTFTF